MRRKVVAVWVSLLIIVSSIVILVEIAPIVQAPTTLYVGGAGGGNYSKIQWAIDNASNGDTVYVYSGIYYEALIINKEINLTGENKEVTIIDANESTDVIHISENNVNIQGFTVTGGIKGSLYGGIYLNSVINCRIINNNISDAWHGIYLSYSNNIIILDNYINLTRGSGIYLESSRYITITNNTMIDNGIYIESSFITHWNTHNINISNKLNGKPVYYLKNQTSGNVPQGAGQVILANCNNIWIENQEITNVYSAVAIGYCTNIFIMNNNLSYGYRGIYLKRSDHINIMNNTITNCTYGIFTIFCENNLYKINRISNSETGMVFYYSESNNITANSIISSRYYGVKFTASSNYNEVHDNYLKDNGQGITLGSIMHCNMTENTMIGDGIYISGTAIGVWNTHNIDTSNTVNGKPLYYWKDRTNGTIPLGAGEVILANCTNVIVEKQEFHNQTAGIILGNSFENHLKENNISLTIYGIYLDHSNFNNINDNILSENSYSYKAWISNYNNITRNSIIDSVLYSIYLQECNNNTFHHNNLIDSSSVDIFIPSDSADNLWNDGHGEGNYWSDYTGLDDGSSGRIAGDGVGDTQLLHHGRDNYPLMEQYPDSNPPQIQLISPANNSVVLSGTIVDFIVTDYHLDNVHLSIDDGPMMPFSSPYNIFTDTWLDGLHKITIIVDDTFNNSINESYYFIIDSKIPEIISQL